MNESQWKFFNWYHLLTRNPFWLISNFIFSYSVPLNLLRKLVWFYLILRDCFSRHSHYSCFLTRNFDGLHKMQNLSWTQFRQILMLIHCINLLICCHWRCQWKMTQLRSILMHGITVLASYFFHFHFIAYIVFKYIVYRSW